MTSYEQDLVAWASEQADLIRKGCFDQLDLTHIADEIEDVGKSEQRELARKVSLLLMLLLQWAFQSDRRNSSLTSKIREQRKSIARHLDKAPSLARSLSDQDWLEDAWLDARNGATKETGIDFDRFPEGCPWAMVDVLREDWVPGESDLTKTRVLTAAQEETLALYSQGKICASEAKADIACDTRELIALLGQRGLPLPRVSYTLAEKMAGEGLELLNIQVLVRKTD